MVDHRWTHDGNQPIPHGPDCPCNGLDPETVFAVAVTSNGRIHTARACTRKVAAELLRNIADQYAAAQVIEDAAIAALESALNEPEESP